MREPLERVLAGDSEVLRGASEIAGPLKMHCDDSSELAASFGIQGDERFSSELVKGASVLLEQGGVRGVLNERMPE